jgi:hypothetical protein
MTTTITRTCPAWCADHRADDADPDLYDEEPFEWHNTAQIAWSDAGGRAWVNALVGEPVELTITTSPDDAANTLDVVATPDEIRRLAEALLSLAERMEADQ